MALPIATPFITPDALPIVATDVLLLDHVPPEEASLSVADVPAQIPVGPVIGEIGLTVILYVVKHPVGNV